MTRAALLVLLALAAGPALSQPASMPAYGVSAAPIRLGLIPFLPETQLRAAFAPLVEHLSTIVGRPIEVIVGANYDEAIAFTVSGKVDLAYLTPACYVTVRQQRPDLTLLLSDIRGGLDFYTSVLLVRDSDHVERVEDLRGRRIVFVDRESTSGYVYPLRYLTGLGLTPTDFAEMRFSGNHRRSVEMLLAREADVVAISSNFLEGARAEGMDLSDVAVLARAGVIPQHAVCSTNQLPPDIEARLVDALLAITSLTDWGRRLLPAGMRLNGWKRAVPADYDDVERTMKGGAPASRY